MYTYVYMYVYIYIHTHTYEYIVSDVNDTIISHSYMLSGRPRRASPGPAPRPRRASGAAAF